MPDLIIPYGAVNIHLLPDLVDVGRKVMDHGKTLVPVGMSLDSLGARWLLRINEGRSRLEEQWLSTDISFESVNHVSPSATALLAAHYAAVLHEREGIFCAHATAVSAGGEAIVLCGPSRSGKTTLSLLLEEVYGLSFISSNQTYIQLCDGGPCVVGGTTGITVRGSGSGRFALRSLLSGSRESDVFSLLLLDRELTEIRQSIPIRAVIFISIWPKPAQWASVTSPEEELFGLFSEMPRLTVLFKEAGLISWPFDSRELTRARMEFVSKMAGRVPIIYVSGHYKDIARLISRRFGHASNGL